MTEITGSLTCCATKRISPTVGVSSPERIEIKVVFPEPLGPRTIQISFSEIDRSNSLSAKTALVFSP